MHSLLFGHGHRLSGGNGHAPQPPATTTPPPNATADAPETTATTTADRATSAETHPSSFGLALRQGRRSTMEDFAAAKWVRCPRTGNEIGLFGVYDGHGGAHAASFISRELLDAVLAHELFSTDLPGALVSAFEATDARYLEEGARRAAEEATAAAAAAAAAASTAGGTASSPRSTPPPTTHNRSSGFYYYYGANGARSPGGSCRSRASSAGLANGHLVTAAAAPPGEDGSTAVVAVLLPDGTLAVANCGDSRAVLMRSGRAHTLSVDHKPNLREERLRVEKAGGAVLWSGVWRVGIAGANSVGGGCGGCGLLALSRAFGDRPLKLRAGVVATPDVKVVKLTSQDKVLVLASDGLWDVMNAQEALMIADRETCAASAARRLAHEALERGSMDNVSALVVKLSGVWGGADVGGAAGAAAGSATAAT